MGQSVVLTKQTHLPLVNIAACHLPGLRGNAGYHGDFFGSRDDIIGEVGESWLLGHGF